MVLPRALSFRLLAALALPADGKRMCAASVRSAAAQNLFTQQVFESAPGAELTERLEQPRAKLR